MAGRKFSGAEYDQRINDIIKLVARGKSGYSEMMRWIAENYDISKDQAAKDIGTARRRIQEMVHDDLKSEVEDAVMRYKSMMDNALINMAASEDQRDKKGWAAEYRTLQNDLSKLLGLDAAQKLDVTTKGESFNRMSDKEIEQRLKELKELKDQIE